MIGYQFALIRMMPNRDRGETMNVGIVVLSKDSQAVKIDSQFVVHEYFRADMEEAAIRAWREYFREKLIPRVHEMGEAHHKESRVFWSIVRDELLSMPFLLGATREHFMENPNVDDVAEELYQKLVL